MCLGHYANKGLGAPVGTSRLGATHFFLVELTDGSKSRISGEQIIPMYINRPCDLRNIHSCLLSYVPLTHYLSLNKHKILTVCDDYTYALQVTRRHRKLF